MLLREYRPTWKIQFVAGCVRSIKKDREFVTKPANEQLITVEYNTIYIYIEGIIVKADAGNKTIHIDDSDYVVMMCRAIADDLVLLAYKNESNGYISHFPYEFISQRAKLSKLLSICIIPIFLLLGYFNPLKFDFAISLILIFVAVLACPFFYKHGCFLEKNSNELIKLKNKVENMETPEFKLNKLKQHSIKYLKELLAKGATINYKAVFLSAEALNMSKTELVETEDYLKSKGFIDLFTDQGETYLTSTGISYLESVVCQSNNQLLHPNITNNIFTAPVTTVQSGFNNTANIKQSWGINASEVKELIEQLRKTFEQLPEEQRVEALDLVVGIEREVQTTQPSKARIKTFLNALVGFATDTAQKTIIEILKNQTGV